MVYICRISHCMLCFPSFLPWFIKRINVSRRVKIIMLLNLQFSILLFPPPPPPPPPPDNLWTLIALYVVFTFCASTTPSYHFVNKIFWNETWGSPEWQGGLPEKWPRDATTTLTLKCPGRNWHKPLSEKWPRGATTCIKPRVNPVSFIE